MKRKPSRKPSGILEMNEKSEMTNLEKHELVEMLMDAHAELREKKLSLREARSRLMLARKKIRALRDTVYFQRKRIVDLYKNQPGNTE